MIANEFWGANYVCSQGELSPPTSVANFYDPYPIGFAGMHKKERNVKTLKYFHHPCPPGNQACGITSGTSYAVNQFDLWDYSWIKWVFLVVVCCYWLIWTVLAYLALRFIRYLKRLISSKNLCTIDKMNLSHQAPASTATTDEREGN